MAGMSVPVASLIPHNSPDYNEYPVTGKPKQRLNSSVIHTVTIERKIKGLRSIIETLMSVNC